MVSTAHRTTNGLNQRAKITLLAILLVNFSLPQCDFPAAAEEPAKDPSNATLIQSLEDIWSQQRHDLSSFEVQYRSIRRKVPDGHTVSRDTVRTLIDKLAKDNGSKTLAEVAVALVPDLQGLQPPWANGNFKLDGESFRCEESIPGHKNMSFTLVQQNGYELRVRHLTNTKIQIDVMRDQTGVKFGPEGVNDFVVVPAVKFMEDAEITRIAPATEDDRLLISKRPVELIISPTGFVHRLSRGTYGSGRYSETVQLSPQKHGETVVMPRLYFRGQYRGDRLSSFSLRLIDKLITDPKLMTKSFQIAALPSDNVIDHTKGGLEMVKLAKPTNDILDMLLNTELERIPLRRSR